MVGPLVLLCNAGGLLLAAELLRVDIDAAFPARSDTTAAGFTQWALTGDLDAAKRSAARTFATVAGPVTCTVRQLAPSAPGSTIYLNASWLNKNGIAGGYKLAFDGVWVHQKDDAQQIDRPCLAGGALELSLNGLAPGSHTLTTYHNNLWGSQHGAMSRCRVLVDGVPVTTVTPSVQVTNDNDCAAAFFTVTVTAGKPVVVSFVPDGSGPFDGVILNGFEIDRAAAPGAIAVDPSPADGDYHVAGNLDTPAPGSEGKGAITLAWTAAVAAVSHDVYFGTDAAAVAAATRASPQFKGNQTRTTFDVAGLNSSLTYYWRVDEVTAAGNTITGSVWSFRVRHLAFPGAEGYGRFARGGRGGRVIEVTNLLDYDTAAGDAPIAGSYRAAIEATGPRTVVFRVSGVIRLKKPCTIAAANSEITIAGQTAPGEGICLANYSAGIAGARDVVMRFMRDRVGEAARAAMDGIGMGVGTDHSIVDHCTISWTIDEGTSSRDGRNITFQRNLISEALQHSYHYAAADRTKYETHAFAGSISGEIGSYHHNLLAHCTDRNWSLAGGLTQDGKYAGRLDIRNNVVYNWTARTTDGGVKACNFVNNYYKPGPAGGVKWLLRPDAGSAGDRQQYYMSGNILEGAVTETTNWSAGVSYQSGVTEAMVRVDQPFFPDHVTTHTAKEAYKLVLSDVGANQPLADAIDRRIVQEVKTGTWHYQGARSKDYPNGYVQPPAPNFPGIIDTPTDVRDAAGSPNYPWPMHATYRVPVDTDHDGMPDSWEIAMGSDPRRPNHNDDPDGDGYTLLEDYLNWLAGPHAYTVAGQAIDVDLLALAAGFTSPRISVLAPVQGTVALTADGRVARFTPAAGAVGRAGFSYTITDADGVTLTGFHGVCITSEPVAYEAEPDSRLANLSVRAVARSRDMPLIIGFVARGGDKPLLMRAVGPALAAFGVAGTLPDPRLEVHSSASGSDRVIAVNEDWGDAGAAAALRRAFTAVGAFPLAEGSKDAALALTVSGANSAAVFDAANRSGVALAELYDAEVTTPARLVNASVLNFAGSGPDVLIVGLVVNGTGPKRLLVRAAGPVLTAFGRAGALPDPKLELVGADGLAIAANDDWGQGDVTRLRAAFRETGAFDFADTASKDAALLVTVMPGAYSALVSAGGGQTGDVLLEVYELP